MATIMTIALLTMTTTKTLVATEQTEMNSVLDKTTDWRTKHPHRRLWRTITEARPRQMSTSWSPRPNHRCGDCGDHPTQCKLGQWSAKSGLRSQRQATTSELTGIINRYGTGRLRELPMSQTERAKATEGGKTLTRLLSRCDVS